MNLTLIAALLTVAALIAVAAVVARASTTDLVRRIRGRLTVVVGTFVAIAVVSWWLLSELPALSGVLLLVSPGLAATIGICLFGFVPFRDRDRSTVRTASLAVRTTGTVLTARMIAVPAATLAVLALALAVTGSSADANGVTVSVTDGVSVGPYPGWFYGVPILATAVALVAATAAAVRRSVLLPAAEVLGADEDRWRRFIGSTLSGVVTSGLLIYLAEIAWLTGRSFNSASRLSGGDAILSSIGSFLVVTSPLLLVFVVVLLTRVGLDLRRLAAPVTVRASRS